jgi:hypothetical protein
MKLRRTTIFLSGTMDETQMRAMIATCGAGSGVDDGQFLDPVVIAPARKTIACAEAPL